MKVSVVARVRIGFSVAIFTGLVIAELLATEGVDIRHAAGAIFCLALGLTGFVVWITSRRDAFLPDPEAPPGPNPSEHPLARFRSRRYWGMVVMLSAVVLAAASAYRYAPLKPPSLPPHQPKLPVSHPPSNPPIVFPPLKLQAVIVHGTQSSAQINGHLLRLGEGFEGVRLIRVDVGHAVVEFEGQTNVIFLSK